MSCVIAVSELQHCSMDDVLSSIASIRQKIIEWEQKTPNILDLRDTGAKLKTIYDQLESLFHDHKSLREEVAVLRNKVEELKLMVQELLQRETPITLREAMRMLERSMCFDASNKSKTKFRSGNYCFSEIAKTGNSDVIERLKSIQDELGVNNSVLATMRYLQKAGDFCVHQERPLHSIDEWREMLVQALSDEDEDAQTSELEDSNTISSQINTILSLMNHYHPDLRFVDSVDQPQKKPVKISALTSN